MADAVDPAPDGVLARRRARRRRRHRRSLVAGLVLVLVAGGAGTAWAMRGSAAPAYRLSTVRTATVEQTVGADGTLAARKTAAAAFAAAGTVASVGVAVGDKVSAGQSLATLDPTSLDAAVTAARTKLAQARQRLADDEDAQASVTTSTSTSGTTGTSTGTSTGATANFTAFDAARVPSSGASDGVSAAQRAVVSAQRSLDTATSTQDDLVATLLAVCRAAGGTSTVEATPHDDGTVAGTADGQVVVTLLAANGDRASTSSQNPQTYTDGGTYTFAGLDTGQGYTVQLVHTGVSDAGRCASQAAQVGNQQMKIDTARTTLETALSALTRAVASLSTTTGTTTGTTGTKAGTKTGSGTTGSGTIGSGTTGSGTKASTSSGSSTSSSATTVTAEQLAADQKAIDAARADLAVAVTGRGYATLTTPIAGTVAAVDIAEGDTVSAGSSTSTITIVGNGALSLELSIGIADIDLVMAGQSAAVTVDGHTGALPGTVTYVGQTNSSSSTGSSAAYLVSVQLTRTYRSLYDGMGAEVAVDVGHASSAVTVPVSAVHTVGTRHTVEVYSGGAVRKRSVTLGLVGDSLAQVRSGLAAGQQVVLADVGASIPSSDATGNRRSGSGLSGLSGTGGGPGAGPGGGGPP